MRHVLLALIGAAALVFACDGKFEFEDEEAAGAAGENQGPPGAEDCEECGECPECAAIGLVCDRDGWPCVECVSNDQCSSNSRSRCHKELRRCVACVEDNNCRDIPNATCDEFTHKCVAGCATETTPATCGDDFAYCDESRGLCALCSNDHACEFAATGPLCALTSCVECWKKDDCFDGKVCDPVSFKCVECSEWDDCDHDELCDLRTNECVKALEPAGHVR
jgi:hypothetical protein